MCNRILEPSNAASPAQAPEPEPPIAECFCAHAHGDSVNFFYGEWSYAFCRTQVCAPCRRYRNGAAFSGVDPLTGQRRTPPSEIYRARYEYLNGLTSP